MEHKFLFWLVAFKHTVYLKQIKKKKKNPQPRLFLFGGSYNECSYDTFVTREQFINHFAIVSAKHFVSVIVQTVQYLTHLETG